jgi:GNAT superfamily N-acetyltransferase
MTPSRAVRTRKRSAGKNGNGAAPPAALTVRLAGRSDLVPLSFFFDTLLRRDYFVRRGQLEDLVAGKHHQVFVAEIDAVLVGAAITTRGARLVNVLVHPAYRGLGIGKQLLSYSGVSEARAKLDMSTGDPRGFYRHLGFVSTSVRNSKGNIEILRLPPTPKKRAPQERAGSNQKSKNNNTTRRAGDLNPRGAAQTKVRSSSEVCS